MANALKREAVVETVKMDMPVGLAAALERARKVGNAQTFVSSISKEDWCSMDERDANILATDPD